MVLNRAYFAQVSNVFFSRKLLMKKSTIANGMEKYASALNLRQPQQQSIQNKRDQQQRRAEKQKKRKKSP